MACSQSSLSFDSFFAEATSETVLGDAFDFSTPWDESRTFDRSTSTSGACKGCPFNPTASIGHDFHPRKDSLRREPLWWCTPAEDPFMIDDDPSSLIVPVLEPGHCFEFDLLNTMYDCRNSLARLEALPATQPVAFKTEFSSSDSDSESVADTASTDAHDELVTWSQAMTYALDHRQGGDAMTSTHTATAPSITVGKPNAAKPKTKKNRKPVYWTAEDHAKFLMGLEKFGLQKGLGPGGAELMSVFMGDRTVLQIKSHFQKHMLDMSMGRV